MTKKSPRFSFVLWIIIGSKLPFSLWQWLGTIARLLEGGGGEEMRSLTLNSWTGNQCVPKWQSIKREGLILLVCLRFSFFCMATCAFLPFGGEFSACKWIPLPESDSKEYLIYKTLRKCPERAHPSTFQESPIASSFTFLFTSVQRPKEIFSLHAKNGMGREHA